MANGLYFLFSVNVLNVVLQTQNDIGYVITPDYTWTFVDINTTSETRVTLHITELSGDIHRVCSEKINPAVTVLNLRMQHVGPKYYIYPTGFIGDMGLVHHANKTSTKTRMCKDKDDLLMLVLYIPIGIALLTGAGVLVYCNICVRIIRCQKQKREEEKLVEMKSRQIENTNTTSSELELSSTDDNTSYL